MKSQDESSPEITERKRTEEALRENEERFWQMAQNVKVVFWLSDLKIDRIFYVSPAYEEIWGQSCESLYENPKSFLDPIHEEDRELALIALRGFEEGKWNVEYRIVRPDGAIRWIEDRGFPIKNQSGTFYRMAGTATDITERKRAEEKLLQSERLAAIGEMVAGLAHESRNALQRGQAALERLALQFERHPEASTLIPKGRELIAAIQQAQEDLEYVYDEVKAYAAPLTIRRGMFDLGKIVQEAWNYLASELERREISFRQGKIDLDLHCEVDPVPMRQVFRNILENSLSACSDPVEITVAWCEAEISAHPAIQISLHDNGPGLTPEAKEKIFLPFYTTKTKGTGLDMAIARRIVEAHAGHIRIDEGSGQGTRTVITRPRKTR